MEEIWKDIKGYEGCYQVSNLGRVKSLERDIHYENGTIKHRKERIMKPQNLRGYNGINLYKENTYKVVLVHRLVADAFMQPFEGKTEIDHINTIRSDNRVENLRWVTRKENQNNYLTRVHKSAVCKDTAKKIIEYFKRGQHCKSKPVVQLSLDFSFVKRFWGAQDVQNTLGISASDITQICKKKRMKSRGYIWMYEEDYLALHKD